jgi:hypothetical protein
MMQEPEGPGFNPAVNGPEKGGSSMLPQARVKPAGRND